MSVLEANRDPKTTLRVIDEMQRLPLPEIASDPYIKAPFDALFSKHHRNIDLVKKKATLDKGVVFFDVADEGLDSINKFISYYLYPEARYTVWVGRSHQRAKISIGSNPWRPALRTHDLSKIAERYGGGGHPVVAGVSFDAKDLDRARAAAAEVLAELKG